jgi:hypothetical protein
MTSGQNVKSADGINYRHRVAFPRRVLTMKHNLAWLVLLLIFLLIAGLYAGATTCVSNKKFKVKKACGTVTDPTGVPIPKVDVELLDNQSVVLRRAITDEDGRFNVPNVAKGEYVLRVKSAFFVVAWQPIIVTKTSANSRCSKPMEVRLDLAGRCSSVSKPR